MGDHGMLRKYRVDNEVPRGGEHAERPARRDRHDGHVEIPLTRYALFGSGRLELSDNIAAVLQVNFSEDETDTQLGSNCAISASGARNVPHGTGIYAPSVGAGGATLPAYLPGGAYGLNCAATGGCTNSQVWPTSPELNQLLNSRPFPDRPWILQDFTDYAGNRTHGERHADVSIPGRLRG